MAKRRSVVERSCVTWRLSRRSFAVVFVGTSWECHELCSDLGWDARCGIVSVDPDTVIGSAEWLEFLDCLPLEAVRVC